MSERADHPIEESEEQDPALKRIQRDRKPGELESGMMSGSDEGVISATERFEGEITREEALKVLDPDEEEPAADK